MTLKKVCWVISWLQFFTNATKVTILHGVSFLGMITPLFVFSCSGALCPLGGAFGYKGTGLGIMVDLLSGVLSNSATGKRVTGISQLLNCLSIKGVSYFS